MLIKTGHPNLLTVMIFFVLTWWIINKLEKCISIIRGALVCINKSPPEFQFKQFASSACDQGSTSDWNMVLVL